MAQLSKVDAGVDGPTTKWRISSKSFPATDARFNAITEAEIDDKSEESVVWDRASFHDWDGPEDHGPGDHGPDDHGPDDHGPDHGPDIGTGDEKEEPVTDAIGAKPSAGKKRRGSIDLDKASDALVTSASSGRRQADKRAHGGASALKIACDALAEFESEELDEKVEIPSDLLPKTYTEALEAAATLYLEAIGEWSRLCGESLREFVETEEKTYDYEAFLMRRNAAEELAMGQTEGLTLAEIESLRIRAMEATFSNEEVYGPFPGKSKDKGK